MIFRPHVLYGTGNVIGISDSTPPSEPKKKKEPLLRIYPKTVDSFLTRKDISVTKFMDSIGIDLYNKIKKTTIGRFILVSVAEAELIAKTLGVSTFNLGTAKRHMEKKPTPVGTGGTIPINDKYLKELISIYGNKLFENRRDKKSAKMYYMNSITLKPGTVRRICSEIFAIDGTAEEYTYSKLVN